MKQFSGHVISIKMTDTVIVKVSRKWKHPVYKKVVNRTKNYACDSKNMSLVEGDFVLIQETKPLSKTKRFRVVEKVTVGANK